MRGRVIAGAANSLFILNFSNQLGEFESPGMAAVLFWASFPQGIVGGIATILIAFASGFVYFPDASQHSIRFPRQYAPNNGLSGLLFRLIRFPILEHSPSSMISSNRAPAPSKFQSTFFLFISQLTVRAVTVNFPKKESSLIAPTMNSYKSKRHASGKIGRARGSASQLVRRERVGGMVNRNRLSSVS